MSVTAHQSIYQISPYIGGDAIPKGMNSRVVLASNENAYGTSPHVIATIAQNISCFHNYPSGEATSLKEAIANHFKINPQQIICGNGSEDILHLIARCFAGPNDEIISPQYGFQIYKIITLSVGAKVVYVPQPNYQTEPDLILEAISSRTKIIYLDNPANPLGTYISKKSLLKLVKAVPSNILITLDAAYADFLDEGDGYSCGLEFVSKFPNIIVTRTFSKLYGLASLRLGWGYASSQVINLLNRIRSPFNVSRIAQIAGIAALEDNQWAQETRRKILLSRKNFENFLTKKKIPFLRSGGNFILIECPNQPEKTAIETYKLLGQKGILLRPVTPYNLPNHLRITIGTEEQMKELCTVLESLWG